MPVKLKLQEVSLFKHVPPELASILNECATVIQKNANEVVVVEGEPVAGMYIVLEGQVKVQSGNPYQPLTYIGANEAFGEMSIIENTNASATIRADNKAVLVFIHRQRFLDKMQKNHDLASAFYKGVAETLSKRLRQTTRQVGDELNKRLKMNEDLQPASSNLSQKQEQVLERIGQLREGLVTHQKSWQKTLLELEKQQVPGLSAFRKDVEWGMDKHLKELDSLKSSVEELQAATVTMERCLISF